MHSYLTYLNKFTADLTLFKILSSVTYMNLDVVFIEFAYQYRLCIVNVFDWIILYDFSRRG